MTAERGSSPARWRHQFSEVDREIMKMASIAALTCSTARNCAARSKTIRASSRANPAAFEKLHTLLKARYLLRERAAGAIGEQGAQQAIDEAVAELVAKFDAARSGPGPK